MKNKLFQLSLATALTVPVVVTVIPTQTEAAVTFKDVQESYVYYNIIGEMSGAGIINGYEDGTFRPGTKITRKHAAALVSRATMNTLPVKEAAYQFKDMPTSNPSYADVRRLQQAGLFKPDKNGNFNPNTPITRAEMARILVVAFDLKVKANYDFLDVPASHEYSQDIRALYSNGITTGKDGKFMPSEGLSRAHYALFMHRAMNLDENHVAKPVEPPPNVSVSAIEQVVFDLTNIERQKAGLKPLQSDSKLMNSARQKSNDMSANKYFSHTSPTYGSPFDQMKANGISYRSAAENIAMGQRTAKEVVEAWMNSPGHKKNILTPEFTHIGIGYDANGYYWTQQFIGK